MGAVEQFSSDYAIISIFAVQIPFVNMQCSLLTPGGHQCFFLFLLWWFCCIDAKSELRSVRDDIK